MAIFEKDGSTREANTPEAAVKLRFTGWREIAPPTEAEDRTASAVDEQTEGAAAWHD